MNFHDWRPYVSVAKRRADAAWIATNMAKSGVPLSPVEIRGRNIANTFWGKAWCRHIESFGDYSNRLPRGRSYARNGAVIDLQIEAGSISALVMGTELYKLEFTVKPLAPARWKAIKEQSVGRIDSLIELLQGRFSDAVMRGITDRDGGLFPAPSEIKKSCSCPDWAGLCKHLAAALYGIGARLDEKPELLFLLRGVDHLELLESAPVGTAGDQPGTLDAADIADVFGIELATPEHTPAPTGKPAAKRKPPAGKAVRKKAAKKSAAPARPKPPTRIRVPSLNEIRETIRRIAENEAIAKKSAAKRKAVKKAAKKAPKKAAKKPAAQSRKPSIESRLNRVEAEIRKGAAARTARDRSAKPAAKPTAGRTAKKKSSR